MISSSPLASITSAIEYVSDPQVEPFACLLRRSQRRGEKAKKIPIYGKRTTTAVLPKKLKRFSSPQGGYTLRVIEEAEVMRQAPQPGEGRRAMPPIGTKERRLRRRRSPIGHSNRAQFYFAKRSNFFLCVLARIIKSNQSLVVRRVCPKGTQALWCLLLNLSFLRVFPRSLRLSPFLKASSLSLNSLLVR